jgi:hypothetical protein
VGRGSWNLQLGCIIIIIIFALPAQASQWDTMGWGIKRHTGEGGGQLEPEKNV